MSSQTSQARVAANRRNAQRSTGPRTAEGKARSSRNAVTHGLCSESPASLADAATGPITSATHATLLTAFTADLHPSGPVETALVARLASIQHRLQRLTAIESGLFERSISLALDYKPELAAPDQSSLEDCIAAAGAPLLAQAYTFTSSDLNLLSLYEARLTRDFHRALAELRRAQTLRLGSDDNRRDQPPLDPKPPCAAPEIENEQTNPTVAELPEIPTTCGPVRPSPVKLLPYLWQRAAVCRLRRLRDNHNAPNAFACAGR